MALKKFKSIADGKIRRYQPDLCLYDRETRFDTTPQYVIDTIDKFFRRHVDESPNKRDIVKRRHPLHRAQVEPKQAMLRYQTMNELWHIFLKEHPEMATEMQNKNLPNTAPMLFWTHAPWEMQKALDSGCLCKACESFHLLR